MHEIFMDALRPEPLERPNSQTSDLAQPLKKEVAPASRLTLLDMQSDIIQAMGEGFTLLEVLQCGTVLYFTHINNARIKVYKTASLGRLAFVYEFPSHPLTGKPLCSEAWGDYIGILYLKYPLMYSALRRYLGRVVEIQDIINLKIADSHLASIERFTLECISLGNFAQEHCPRTNAHMEYRARRRLYGKPCEVISYTMFPLLLAVVRPIYEPQLLDVRFRFSAIVHDVECTMHAVVSDLQDKRSALGNNTEITTTTLDLWESGADKPGNTARIAYRLEVIMSRISLAETLELIHHLKKIQVELIALGQS